MNRHVYGPVPSRRLGRSLGVSPVPGKTCTYSCVYCQLGRTTCQTVGRRRFFPPGEILAEVEESLMAAGGELDHVTFVGDGEPTLSSDVGHLINAVKEMSDVPVAVVTNGSLFSDPAVRSDLARADRVLPTLATVDPVVWRRLHRPHRDLELGTVLDGLVDLSQEYGGDLWLEVMLVAGLNDDEASLADLHRVIAELAPGRVDVMVPIRPPTEPWVEAPDPERVLRAMETLGLASAPAIGVNGGFNVRGYSSAREALWRIGSRHPLSMAEARDICASMGDASALEEMLEDGEMVRVRYGGQFFLVPRRPPEEDDAHESTKEER